MVSIVFATIGAPIAPVFIAPLFNDCTVRKDRRIEDSILRLARANRSGFLGATRIRLDDNLLNRRSPEAIEAAMGHEMGAAVRRKIGCGYRPPTT